MKDTIIYDQPVNEIIRVCLRLEQLFQQIDHQLEDLSTLGTRHIVHLIINLLHLLDRPDLKAKLAKELSYHLTNLMRYGNMPEIDSKKLHDLTQQLEDHSRNLIDSNGKIGHRLRDIELLNTLRLHLASPGGGCSFDLPIYHYWLRQANHIRHETITNWLQDFSEIRTVVALVLDLVRRNAKTEQKTAVHGFHQELLDPQSNMRMIRIGITNSITAYPEISIGRHFLSVRFYSPDIEKRPVQYTENLAFWIAYCNS
ncbi:MAG: cell division protein ZapD [Gammaproteobacteria bacterium]|nr:cell division protein ZapD [Gammaproteobacteria bacterium]